MKALKYVLYIKSQGVGAIKRAAHAAIHVPKAALQAMTAAGAPAPPVTVPKVSPRPA